MVVWLDGIIILVYYYYLFNYVDLLYCLSFVFVVFGGLGMAINVQSVQYNGVSLPDIILLTQGYYLTGEPT